jgi:maltokinase
VTERLLDRLAELPAAALFPDRLAVEGADLPGKLTPLAVDQFGDGMWLALLVADDVAFACPIVEIAGQLRRARPGDGAARALLERLGAGATVDRTFDWRSLHAQRVGGDETAMGVDQTHDSVIVGSAGVVKWMVRAEPSPAPDLVAHLAANGFTAMPTPLGFVTAEHRGMTVVLVSVASFLPGATDGWDWLVDDVTDHARGDSPLAEALSPVQEVGRIVATMHVAASTPSNVLQAPTSEATSSIVQRWQETARGLLADAVDEVSGAEGERLRSLVPQIEATFDAMRDVDRTVTMPIHGDLHVGQILRWSDGYAINDFDGNPVLSPADRLAPEPAARDVAGMLQALDHVGRIVRKRREGVDHDRVLAWIKQAQVAFLDSYRSGLAAGGRPDLLDERLLKPFRVEQELREFLYAERHLPRWRYVPDAAMPALFV